MDGPTEGIRPRRWLEAELWGILTFLALIHLALDFLLVANRDDTENLESTRVYAAAGQFLNGPGTIYGPYTRANPWLLIQAPLYYRLTGLGAWPLVKLGISPVTACFISGRALSLASMLALLAVVGALARLDGGPRRAGAWAICLLAASRLVDPYAITMRPDVAGIFLQTLGAYLILRVVWGDRPPGLSLYAAYLAFAMSFCMKQHNVAAGSACTLLLAGSWLRRRELRRPIERALLAGLAVVVLYLLAEEFGTSGRMSFCVFQLPARFRTFSSASWDRIIYIAIEVGIRSVVLIGFGTAILLVRPRALGESRLDAVLWLLIAMELGIFGFTCYKNDGSWVNYGIPAIVFTCILLGRALSRIVEARPPAWRVLPLAVVAVAVLYEDVVRLAERVQAQRYNEASLNGLYQDPEIGHWSPRDAYFVGLPQYNRLLGRADLVHDEWLYGQFERVRAAEPRTNWLLPELTSGPTRLVIVPFDPPFPISRIGKDRLPIVPGLASPLPAFGYRKVVESGRFEAWERGTLGTSPLPSEGATSRPPRTETPPPLRSGRGS